MVVNLVLADCPSVAVIGDLYGEFDRERLVVEPPKGRGTAGHRKRNTARILPRTGPGPAARPCGDWRIRLRSSGHRQG